MAVWVNGFMSQNAIHRGIRFLAAACLMALAACGGSSSDSASDPAPDGSESTTTEAPATSVATTTTVPPEPELNPDGLEPSTFIELGTADEIDLVRFLATGPAGVWVSVRGNDDNEAPSRAVLIEPDSESVLLDVEMNGRAGTVSASDGAGWFVNAVAKNVSRVDAASGEVVEIADARCVAASGSTVWTGDFLSAYRVDETTGAPTGDTATISVDVASAALGDMDPAFLAYMTDPANEGADFGCSASMVVAGNNLWIPSATGPALAQFDSNTGEMLSLLGLGDLGEVRALVAAGEGVWAVSQTDESGEIVTSAWLIGGDGTLAKQVELGFVEGWTGQAFAADGFVVIESTEGPADGTGNKNIYLFDPSTGELAGTMSTELVHTFGIAAAEGKLFFSTDSPFGVQVFE